MIRVSSILILALTLAPSFGQRSVKPINTFTDLAAANVLDINTNAFLVGGSTPGDGYQGIFTYLAGSSAAAVSNQVIVPNSGSGRWVRQSYLGTSGSGTAGYVPKFSSATNLVNSLIQDNSTNIIINAGGGSSETWNFKSASVPKDYQTTLRQSDIEILRVTYDGDSIVQQTNPTWPDYVPEYSPYFAAALYTTNYGVSGERVGTIYTNWLTRGYLNRPQGTNQTGWFFLHGGGNDLADGTSTNQVYIYLTNIWYLARQAGYQHIVACTVTPRSNFLSAPTLIPNLNTLIRSDPTKFDYLLDFNLVLTNYASTNEYYDGTHPSYGPTIEFSGARRLAQTASTVTTYNPWQLYPTTDGGSLPNTMAIALRNIYGPLIIPRTLVLSPSTGIEVGVIYKGSTSGGGVITSGSPWLHDYTETGTDGRNTFFGISSGNFTMAGTGAQASYHTAIGYGTLTSLTTGSYDTALGYGVLQSVTTGSQNTAAGFGAGFNVTTGSGNTMIGYSTGQGVTTGDNNTIVGANVTGLSASLSGNVIVATGAGTVRAQHNGTDWSMNGNVNASTGFQIGGLATSGYYIRGNGTTGVFAPLAANELATGLVPTARLGNGVADATTFLRGDQTWATPTSSGGTVTSVALSLPSFITVSGSPVTTSGTLTGTLATQTTNAFFVGPTTGAAAAPTFRGMVAADIPDALIVATSKLSATGTKDSTTFLRGDDTWAIPSGGSGTFFANPSASIGLSAINGSDTNAMRADAAPALSQAIVPTWTGTHIFRKTTTPVEIQYDATHGLEIAIDSTGTPTYSTTTGTNQFSGIADATVGWTVAGAAASASYLRGDGTKGVFASLSASDLATGTVPTARLGSGVASSSTFLRGDNTWAVPSGGSGTFFADPTATVGTAAINGTSTNAMRADAAPALNLAINPTWTGSHIFRNTVVPLYVSYDVGNYAALAVSSIGDLTITPTGGDMTLQGRLNASTGFLVAGAAASGSYIRGNGTEGVFAVLSASDLATGTVPTARLGSGAAGATTFLRGDQTWATAVTSVGLSMPGEFTVGSSPITTSGTLSVSKANQSANLVYAGPTSGSAAQPTFRALTRADVTATGGGFGITFLGATVDMKSAAATETDIWTNTLGQGFIFTGLGILTTNMTGSEGNLPQFQIGSSTTAPSAYFSGISLDDGTNSFYQVWTTGISSSTAESMPVVAATSGTIRLRMVQASDATTRSAIFYIHGYYPPSN